MDSNKEEIIQGTINYYKKEIVDSEIKSSEADAKGNQSCYYDSTKEAQDASFRLFGIDNNQKAINCLLLTEKEDEQIDTPIVPGEKSCVTEDLAGWQFFTKLNTASKNNQDSLNGFIVLLNQIEYVFQNKYSFSLEIGQEILQDAGFQKQFGLDGVVQVVKVKSVLRDLILMRFYEQKIVGTFDLSKYFNTIVDLKITNENGNVDKIIMPKGDLPSNSVDLKDVQIRDFIMEYALNFSQLKIENAPNLKEIFEADQISPSEGVAVSLINLPLLTLIPAFSISVSLILENLPLLPSVILSPGQSSNPLTKLIKIDNLPLITEFGGLNEIDMGFGVEEEGDGIFITNCQNLALIEIHASSTQNVYIPNIVITDTVWDYLSASQPNRLFKTLDNLSKAPNVIDVKDNSFLQANVDQILVDIDEEPWSSLLISGNTIDISGTNSTPGVPGLNAKTALEGKGWTVTIS